MQKSRALEILEQAINYDDKGKTRNGNWILGTESIEAVKIAIEALKNS